MRILLSAFAISPTEGSEWGVGWQFASRLAKHHQVTVLYGDLTRLRWSQIKLDEWYTSHPDGPTMEFVYVAGDWHTALLERLHSKPGMRSLLYIGYHRWQKKALSVARELHLRQPFDLVHQLTYATYSEPGYLWQLGIPFFWGPFSGGSSIPLRYASILGFKGTIEAMGRSVLKSVTLLLKPRIAAAARRARHLWCVSAREQEILSRFSDRTSLMMEVGTIEGEITIRTLAVGETLRIVWSGVHEARKALPILIRAVAHLGAQASVRVHVLGGGYGKSEATTDAKQLAQDLGVAHMFTWLGKLPREQALEQMQTAHVLAHTSLLEGTSTVVLEAISMGLPVICHDACGMATAITPECGLKVPMTGVQESVRGFAQAMQTLIDRPELLEDLSRGAARRAAVLGWDPKIAILEQVYAESLNSLQACGLAASIDC